MGNLAITAVRVRSLAGETISMPAGEAFADVASPARIGTSGEMVRSRADTADNSKVFGVSILPAQDDDTLVMVRNGILELTLSGGQVIPAGQIVVVSRDVGKMFLYGDLLPGEFAQVVGWMIEDNVLQVKNLEMGIGMTNPALGLSVTLTGNINDADWGNAEIVEVDGGAADRNITGMVARDNFFQRAIANVGVTNNLVIKHHSLSSAILNRFENVTGGDITLAPGESASGWYSPAGNIWRFQ